MKKTVLLLLMVLAVSTLRAQNPYSKYYENLPKPMPVPELPAIPERRVSITDFGAVADGQTLNTEAFEKAVAAINKAGGGHIDVPAGVWLTGPFTLKDNTDLHLQRNAVILMTPDKRAHLKTENGQTDDRAMPAINISKRQNVSITGQGIIDGNGEYWRPVKRGKVSDTEWNQFKSMGGTVTPDGKLWYPFGLKDYPDVAATPEAQEKLRAHLIRISDCNRVLIQGITLKDSPRFHLVPQRCTNVVIDGVTVNCPWNAQNGDAMDIGNCKNVLIVNNTINAGDDGICMKGGVGAKGEADGPCENINIQDNIVYHAHGGFVIGSEFCGGMFNIYVHRNTFAGTDTGLRFKSAPGRGGVTKDIYISDIYMTDIKDEAIIFQTDYVDRPAGSEQKKAKSTNDYIPHFQDIHISNVVCRSAAVGVKAAGYEIKDINITNSVIHCTEKTQDIAPDCKIDMNNVKLLMH